MAFNLDYVGPQGAQVGGHYRLGLVTGATTGLTANQAILCMRFLPSAAVMFALLNLRVSANIDTAFGTAQLVDAGLWVNRSWSTAPSGGTTVAFKTSEQQMRDFGGQAMAPLTGLFAGFQIATTGALTTGTRVQDTNAVAYAQFGGSNALGNAAEVEMFKITPGVSHPLILGQSEGLEITVPTAQGATGKVKYYVSMEFAILNTY